MRTLAGLTGIIWLVGAFLYVLADNITLAMLFLVIGLMNSSFSDSLRLQKITLALAVFVLLAAVFRPFYMPILKALLLGAL